MSKDASAKVVTGTFPVLDWGALHKGQTLDAVTCAQAMGVSVARWRSDRLLALRLSSAIRDRRQDLEAHVKCEGDGIAILDDEGANDYTWRRARQCVKGIATQAARRGSIDHSALGSDHRRIAEARDGALGRAALVARRELRDARQENALPPKPGKPEDGGK